MLSKSLEDILLGLSYIETRKQYNQKPLMTETHKDMNDSKKIVHMLYLIQHGLDFQSYLEDLDQNDEHDD